MIVGHGMLLPLDSPKQILAFKAGKDPVRENAIRLISGWGQDIPERSKALMKGRLCVVGEGWSGIVGRLASTLEEVGVPIQTGMKIVEQTEKGVVTSKGIKIEADIVTVPQSILKKSKFYNYDLNNFSIETIEMFYNDAINHKLKLNKL